MKRIIVFILLVIPYFAFSQEITVNKKWIDRDSCWVFTSLTLLVLWEMTHYVNQECSQYLYPNQ